VPGPSDALDMTAFLVFRAGFGVQPQNNIKIGIMYKWTYITRNPLYCLLVIGRKEKNPSGSE
jgi:hypothetical protein